MKTPTRILTLAALNTLCVFLQAGVAGDAQLISPEAENMLQQFESTRDPDLLGRAIRAATTLRTNREVKSRVIEVALLKRLAAYYDPSYDTNPPPLGTRIIPPESAGIRIDFGQEVPPEQVTDPEQRKDYERRLEQNRINIRTHHIQREIRQFMGLLVFKVLGRDPGALERFDAQLTGYDLPQEMATKMKAMAQRRHDLRFKKMGRS